ncbi:MAG: DUF1573 domain-containing protein [Planctomycetia bacterium]|nr:DUF1573 domain-containing protein [Planctomycetia bacterium]
MDAKQMNGFRWSWVLWAGALLPFCASLMVHVGGVKAQPVQATTERDGLAFEQYLVNLGSPPPRSEYAARFAFRNIGTKPLRVLKLEPSCGCLSPRLEKMEFAPGELGEFYLRVRAANERPGLHEYTCKLIYDDGQTRESEVRFKITLPTERIEIRPRALTIYQFNSETTNREIAITDFRAAPEDRPLTRLEIMDVTCSLSWVQVAAGEAHFDDAGQRQQTVIVTLTEVPPGAHNGSIIVKTNIPEYSELRVPLHIEGPTVAGKSSGKKTLSPKADDSFRESKKPVAD